MNKKTVLFNLFQFAKLSANRKKSQIHAENLLRKRGWNVQRKKATDTEFILHFQINYYHLTSVLCSNKIRAEKRRELLVFCVFSYNFCAVSGYHLWCDDVGFTANINIHILCKQNIFSFLQMRKKWTKFETKTLYANKLGPRAVTRRLEKNEIVVIYESFKAFVFMRKRTAIRSKEKKECFDKIYLWKEYFRRRRRRCRCGTMAKQPNKMWINWIHTIAHTKTNQTEDSTARFLFTQLNAHNLKNGNG